MTTWVNSQFPRPDFHRQVQRHYGLQGTVTTLSPSAIQAKGSTLRVFAAAADLPSRGVPPSQYRFAFWAQSQPGNDIANVGSFAPDTTMIPVGGSTGKGLKL
jgi:hypothetical protein